jgi:hypothetical protein
VKVWQNVRGALLLRVNVSHLAHKLDGVVKAISPHGLKCKVCVLQVDSIQGEGEGEEMRKGVTPETYRAARASPLTQARSK